MAHVKAGVVWEGEQMVSGQEKAGLPLPGKGSENEHGLWGGRPGTGTGHPTLQELEDKWDNLTKVQNCSPINYQS